MHIEYDEKQLHDLLHTFFVLTNLRTVVFDKHYNRITSYPKSDCDFCAIMRTSEIGLEKCDQSDRNAFNEAAKTGELTVYRCHAGLIEAVMPLRENGMVTGYLMFGQITDNPDRAGLIEHICKISDEYGLDKNSMAKYASQTSCLSTDRLTAAAKLLEICTEYIVLKELIIPEKDRILQHLDEYLDAHLSDDLHISTICEYLKISRTRLYDLFHSARGKGIAAYIREHRIKHAKILLKTTDMPIDQVAGSVGFSDYNYFCRVFRNITGRSPGAYRKRKQNIDN